MFPAYNSQQRLSASKPSGSSKKVPLQPGRSLVDWVRLTKSGADLKKTGRGLRRISSEELAKHNKPDDMWLSIRGWVYNVTAYLEYHPGGADELMRGAGKDATALFDEVHRWVNYEAMLKECLIGMVTEGLGSSTSKPRTNKSTLAPPAPSATGLNPLGRNAESLSPKSQLRKKIAIPTITLDSAPDATTSEQEVSDKDDQPTYDWYQNNQDVVFVIYSTQSDIKKEQIICDIVKEKTLYVDIIIADTVWTFRVSLADAVNGKISVSVSSAGKIEIKLGKHNSGTSWNTIGNISKSNSTYATRSVNSLRYCNVKIVERSEVTHDTSLYRMRLPESRWMKVPVGRHVYLKLASDDTGFCKPYTVVTPSLLDENPEAPLSTGRDLYFLIKHYDQGTLTSNLKSLSVGDEVSLSTWDGNFDIDTTKNFTTFILLAAGTGFTPMVRVLLHLLEKRHDIKVHLVFFNKQKRDVIWGKELDGLLEKHEDIFSLVNVFSQEESASGGLHGRISRELLENVMRTFGDPAAESTYFFVCGPTMFTKLASDFVKTLGYNSMHAFT